jgi:hypothetical protein
LPEPTWTKKHKAWIIHRPLGKLGFDRRATKFVGDNHYFVMPCELHCPTPCGTGLASDVGRTGKCGKQYLHQPSPFEHRARGAFGTAISLVGKRHRRHTLHPIDYFVMYRHQFSAALSSIRLTERGGTLIAIRP